MRKTNCVLTEEQEIELRDYLSQRLKSLRSDNTDRIEADEASWRAYENDGSCRAGDQKSIFSKSNVHLPITSMIADYFLVRSAAEFPADGEPFFGFKPVGADDQTKAQDFNRYFNWKLDQKGGASSVYLDGLADIYVQRAAIFKCAYRKDAKKWFDREAVILWDKQSKQPVLTPENGFVIKDEDGWSEAPEPIAAEVANVAAVAGAVPPEVPKQTFLTSNPSVVWDATRYEWAPPPSPLIREETLYEGAQPQRVDYDRFLCPSTAESVESADCIAELYDKDKYWYHSMWLERPWNRWADMEAEFAGDDNKAKTEGENKSKENTGFDDKRPVRKVVEFWVRRDIIGYGEMNLCVFFDEASEKLIWYEFVEKICPDRKRPYVAIAIGKGKKRWWGLSMPEKVAQYQDKIDRNFNAEAYRNEMNSNPLPGTDDSVLEDPDQLGDDLVFGPGQRMKMKPGKKIDDYISFASMPNLDANTARLADVVLKLVQEWLHMSDSNMGQLEQTSGGEAQTATGEEIRAEESGTMGRRWNRRIITGYQQLTKKLVQLTSALLPRNQKETFEFFEGQDVLTGTMTGQDIAGLDVDVQILIKKKFTTEERRKAEQVVKIQTAYIMLPPEWRIIMREGFLIQLNSLGVADAEKLLPVTIAPPPLAAPTPTADGGAA